LSLVLKTHLHLIDFRHAGSLTSSQVFRVKSESYSGCMAVNYSEAS
jgi:hypothetical protein